MKPNPTIALRIIACGGTFDKHYDALSGKLGFGTSHLPALLQQARVLPAYELSLLPLQDSLDMQDVDCQRVLACCSEVAERALVIVHGTDTMTDTAAVLGAARLAKTIILTGAMIPVEISNSDALFNLGFACAAALTLPAGVFVAMNGRIFPANDVQKIRAAGVFAPLTEGSA